MNRCGAVILSRRAGLVQCLRRLHDVTKPSEVTEAEEIRIPVPWGHIAGKLWGNSDGSPFIGLHGWEDNAGTFDTLAPLLKMKNFLAIDLPGHGLSSYFPLGRPYYFTDSVVVLRRLMKYFNWDRISLMGHSYGSCTSFVFSSVYPDYVENFISIDCARTLMASGPASDLAQLRNVADKLPDLEQKMTSNSPPSYTYKEIVNLLYSGSLQSPTKESCEVLLKRGMLSGGDNKFYFSRDPRLRFHAMGRLPYEFVLTLAPKVSCNYLSIRGKQGLLVGGKAEENYFETEDLIKKENFKYEHHDVDGSHHVHLNNPERVAPLINNFLGL